MPLLRQKERDIVRKEFEGLIHPVKLVMFTQELECEYCYETRSLVEEIAGLSDKVTAEIYNFVTDKDKAQAMEVDKIPAIAILAVRDGQERDYGIRYYGIPSGYEFGSVIEDIKMVSKGDSGLSPASREAIAKLTQPVHIQVFVTPT